MVKITKQMRIEKEYKRLKTLYVDLDDEQRDCIDGLLRRAAYMRVTLEDYESDLDTKGYVEMFTQSEKAPPYERERPVARLYNTMNRNYQTIMKQLTEAMPEPTSISASEEIMKFVSGGK